jgi:hypothetical protein
VLEEADESELDDAAELDALDVPDVLDAPAVPDALAVLDAFDEPEAAGALPLLRKSVTYHPVPFNWKPAAVNCFLKVDLPQLGQSVSTGSDIFCKTSLANPQSSQR